MALAFETNYGSPVGSDVVDLNVIIFSTDDEFISNTKDILSKYYDSVLVVYDVEKIYHQVRNINKKIIIIFDQKMNINIIYEMLSKIKYSGNYNDVITVAAGEFEDGISLRGYVNHGVKSFINYPYEGVELVATLNEWKLVSKKVVEKDFSNFGLYSIAKLSIIYRSMHKSSFPEISDTALLLMADCYVSSVEGAVLTVSNASVDCGVPLATAIRHMNQLIDMGYVTRFKDFEDSRRSTISLTAPGTELMEKYLTAVLSRIKRMTQ